MCSIIKGRAGLKGFYHQAGAEGPLVAGGGEGWSKTPKTHRREAQESSEQGWQGWQGLLCMLNRRSGGARFTVELWAVELWRHVK